MHKLAHNDQILCKNASQKIYRNFMSVHLSRFVFVCLKLKAGFTLAGRDPPTSGSGGLYGSLSPLILMIVILSVFLFVICVFFSSKTGFFYEWLKNTGRFIFTSSLNDLHRNSGDYDWQAKR